jgi:hypothetical protein
VTISYPPIPEPQSNSEITTTLTAGTTAQTFAANPNRISGFVLNFANRPASVIFGAGVPTAGGAITTPIPASTSGGPGALTLPDRYDGPIQIVWATGVNTQPAVLHEMV